MNSIQTNPGSRWLGVIGISAVVVFLGILAGVVRNNGGNALSFALPTGPTSGSVTPPFVSPSPGTTTTMEPTEIYPPTDDWGATETADANYYATQAVFRVTADYMLTNAPPTQTPVTGIHHTDGPVIFPQYHYENVWSNYINNKWVVVFAGAYTKNLTQGIVVFAWNSEHYETPIQAGSVHIVAEDNFRLTLLSTDGTTFYFDIPGRRFVESLTEIVPTITPTFDPTWLTPWPTCTPIPPSNATAGPCGP